MKKRSIAFTPYLLLVVVLFGGCASETEGPPGPAGQDGAQGPAGQDGSNSCTATDNGDGSYTIDCAGASPIVIQDGQDGAQGPQGSVGPQGSTNDAFQQAITHYQNYRRGVIRIDVICPDGDGGSGTGFKISNNIIATNEHVAICGSGAIPDQIDAYRLDTVKDSLLLDEDANFAEISLTKDTDFSLTIHSEADLAKINISSASQSARDAINSLPTLPYETSSAVVTGTPTLVMGYPIFGLDLIVNIGTISSNDSFIISEYDFAISNDMDAGASGSPIFNISTGKAIGLYSAGWYFDGNRNGETDLEINLGLAVHASKLGESSFITPDYCSNDDKRCGASTLSFDSSLTGNISPGDDIDYWKIEVSPTRTLTIYTTGNLDTEGTLETQSGIPIIRNSNSGSDYNFRIEQAVYSGTYYIKVESWQDQTGSYTLHLM